jgi:hypothetical protein
VNPKNSKLKGDMGFYDSFGEFSKNKGRTVSRQLGIIIEYPRGR